MTLLSLSNLTKSYGALKVTDALSLDVPAGVTLGVLGPNGAGKTTLLNLIGGDVRADGGSIFLDGVDIGHAPPHKRCRMGIGRSYQVPHPFAKMSVFENLLVASTFGAQLAEEKAYEPCVEILRKTGLLARANQRSGSLTLLDRKRLELARALATRPRLLLLDEVAGGLTEHEASSLVELLGEIKKDGMTIVWIEHVVHALLAVADRLVVLNFGAKLAEGEPQEIMNNPEVRRVYMGVGE
ncbi:MAG: ABC transporter ATP-binding protein [Burkholderiaceae bacterium]|jgi:branched-chain amino acid transport system ATP-binding protein